MWQILRKRSKNGEKIVNIFTFTFKMGRFLYFDIFNIQQIQFFQKFWHLRHFRLLTFITFHVFDVSEIFGTVDIFEIFDSFVHIYAMPNNFNSSWFFKILWRYFWCVLTVLMFPNVFDLSDASALRQFQNLTVSIFSALQILDTKEFWHYRLLTFHIFDVFVTLETSHAVDIIFGAFGISVNISNIFKLLTFWTFLKCLTFLEFLSILYFDIFNILFSHFWQLITLDILEISKVVLISLLMVMKFPPYSNSVWHF